MHDIPRRAHTLLIFLLLAVGLFQATAITECGTLATVNGSYTLSNDIVTNSSFTNCLTVTANNITIDCAGYQIHQNQSGHYGIYSTNAVSGLTVQNCEIIGYNGIYGANGRIDYDDYPLGNRNMTYTANNISVNGTGIFTYRARENLDITDNIINTTTGSGLYFYIIESGASARFEDNDYEVSSTGYGIRGYWAVSGYLNVTGEDINAPTGTGIYLQQVQGGSNMRMSDVDISASVGINSYNNGGQLFENSRINATGYGIYLNNNGGPRMDGSNITMTGSGSGYYCGANTATGINFTEGNIIVDTGYCLIPQSGYDCSTEYFANVNMSSNGVCLKDVIASTFINTNISYGGAYGFDIKAASYGNYLYSTRITNTSTNGIAYKMAQSTYAPLFDSVTVGNTTFDLSMVGGQPINITAADNPPLDPERYDSGYYLNVTLQSGDEANLTIIYPGNPANEIDFRLFKYNTSTWVETSDSRVNTTTNEVFGEINATYGNMGIYAVLGLFDANVTNIYLYSPENNTQLCDVPLTNAIFRFLTPNFTWSWCGYYFSDLGEDAADVLINHQDRVDNYTVNDTHTMPLSIPAGNHSLVLFCVNLYPDNSTFLLETSAINIGYTASCTIDNTTNAIKIIFGATDPNIFYIIFVMLMTAVVTWFSFQFGGQIVGLIAGVMTMMILSFIMGLIPAWLGIIALMGGLVAFTLKRNG